MYMILDKSVCQLVEMLWPTQALEAATHHNRQPGNDYEYQMWVDMLDIVAEVPKGLPGLTGTESK